MFIIGDPKPKGSWSVTKKGKFYPVGKTWSRWYKHVASEVKKQWKGPLLDEPVMITLHFYMPRPKSVKRTYPTSRYSSDGDKLERSVADSMTGIVYVDDSRIVRCLWEKEYADTHEAGVIILISTL